MSSEKTVTIEALLDAGLHFGHQTKRWNPKMKRFIHGAKGGIYVIDLQKTLVQIKLAQEFLAGVVGNGRKILFVGTKKQARSIFQEAAEKAGQPYVIYRWLGGMLTNNQTVRKSIKRMEDLQAIFADEVKLKAYPKQEQSVLRRELTKLERNLTGIKDMTSLPGAMFVVDTCREKLAIAEAQRLNIPVVALVDTNADPDAVEYPIPGNDDSIRSLSLIAEILGDTIAEAHDAFVKAKAAEDKRRKDEQDAERKIADAAREERKAKEDEEKKKRAKVLDKLKKEKVIADKAKKDEAKAEKAKAEAKAAEVKVAEAAPVIEEAPAPVVEEAAPVADVSGEADEAKTEEAPVVEEAKAE
ncbi:MAG: 30S ribosomal protein S2 [Kiritimatiellales bacterium]|nr:30S ribosomal protein S2 [Kiritimatiellales bacterium]